MWSLVVIILRIGRWRTQPRTWSFGFLKAQKNLAARGNMKFRFAFHQRIKYFSPYSPTYYYFATPTTADKSNKYTCPYTVKRSCKHRTPSVLFNIYQQLQELLHENRIWKLVRAQNKSRKWLSIQLPKILEWLTGVQVLLLLSVHLFQWCSRTGGGKSRSTSAIVMIFALSLYLLQLLFKMLSSHIYHLIVPQNIPTINTGMYLWPFHWSNILIQHFLHTIYVLKQLFCNYR